MVEKVISRNNFLARIWRSHDPSNTARDRFPDIFYMLLHILCPPTSYIDGFIVLIYSFIVAKVIVFFSRSVYSYFIFIMIYGFITNCRRLFSSYCQRKVLNSIRVLVVFSLFLGCLVSFCWLSLLRAIVDCIFVAFIYSLLSLLRTS